MTDYYNPKPGHKVKTPRGVEMYLYYDTVNGWVTQDAGGVISAHDIRDITYIPRHKVDTTHLSYGPGFIEPWDDPDNPAYDDYWSLYKPRHR